MVRRLLHEPLSSLDRQRRGPNIIATSRQVIVYITSRRKSRIGRLTVSVLSYPWPLRPQDTRQVSKSDICHGTGQTIVYLHILNQTTVCRSRSQLNQQKTNSGVNKKSIMEVRVAKALANWFRALGRWVYLKSSNLPTSSSKYAC